ncbi:hypothetical protein AB1Y20_004854 [Prymnesium parvum]|uniref:Ribosomal RNA methyltransferase FtsJ domain-containing protein n=1 Tax=Prymnesium parvum TaxID=97485 RepID=A0AB34J0F7_PRYPA|mmetsp:Transcript_21768/g.54243  ORF Transcript_21768/g.54243 Transcript_21768/m.54243 type:complete len:523 (-) Transcript_21768:17-1585(-)
MRSVFVRLSVLPSGVAVRLRAIPTGVEEGSPHELPLPALLSEYAALKDGEFSPRELRIRGLRAVRRQRWGKHLQFLALRCPSGEIIEAILRTDVTQLSSADEEALSWAAFQLGDALTVTGLVESCKGQLSIHPRLLAVEESWAALFHGGRYFDHQPPPALCTGSATRGTAMVQCAASHAVRLQEYLASVLSTATIAIVPPVPGADGKQVKRDERCLLLAAAHPAALCKAITADPHASRVVQRWYILSQQARTLDEAMRGLHQLLLARGATASAPLSVRAHAYPRALESKLVQQLRAAGVAELRQRCETLVSLVYSFGSFSYGVGEGACFQGDVCTAALAEDGAVSRAFYKLREVAARCALPLADRRHAIDVGSSPGGWTYFLAQSGCARVSSVDPGALHLPAAPCLAQVEHMRMRVGEALPILRERGVVLDCYVCDMNAEPAVAVGYLLEALSLLADASPVVLTMKNTFKKKPDFEQALEQALTQLNAVSDQDGFKIVHLLANTQKEVTVVGRLQHAVAVAA